MIDGPFKGQRMALPGDSFTEVVGTSLMKGRSTYMLRVHRLLVLVFPNCHRKMRVLDDQADRKQLIARLSAP